MPQPKACCTLQYMICCIMNHADCGNRVYHAAKRDGEEYILDNEGNEYKPQKKFPKVWIRQITQVCPDLETKRKVSPDEDEK